MRVTVTGASGFVGYAVCNHFSASGWTVRGIVRHRGVDAPAWECLRGDLRDPKTAEAALAGSGLVVHAAGLAHIPLYRQNEGQFIRSNVEMTRTLAEAATALNIRMIYVSSEAATSAVTPYGRSKRLAEECLDRLGRSRGLWWTALRPALLFGERDPGNFLRLIVAVSRRRFAYIDGGRARKSLTYVGNVGPALLALARSDATRHRVYHLADPHPYTVREIIQCICDELGRTPPRLSLARPVARGIGLAGTILAAARLPAPLRLDVVDTLSRDVTVDTRELEKDTGFSPPIPFHEGVRRTVEWCRNNHIIS